MKVALLGATGAVGRAMLDILAEREFPVEDLVLLASPRSAGVSIEWQGRSYQVRAPARGVFEGCEVALFSAGGTRSREWAPVAAAEGALVIDNSSAWRMDPDVPLVVPEVNADAASHRPKNIIANPNCSTIQLVIALRALQSAGALRRVVATTFQSVSGAGQQGINALNTELAGGLAADSPFTTCIAGNVIPHIGGRDGEGWNEEETKMRNEARKILGAPDLEFAATCVRVPVAVGHSIAAEIEFSESTDVGTIVAALTSMPGLEYCSGDRDPTPLDVAGSDMVRVGRLRRDPDRSNVVHCWVVADNLRKGAATNAVQIAERVLAA